MQTPTFSSFFSHFERKSSTLTCRFFNKKIGYMPHLDESLASHRPSFDAAVAEAAAAGASGLDVELAASGFSKQNQSDLEAFIHAEGPGSEDAGHGEIHGGSVEEQDREFHSGDDREVCSSDEEGGGTCSSGSAAAAEVGGGIHADVNELADRMASCGAAGPNNRSSRPPGRAAANTHQWLEQHAVEAADIDSAAAVAVNGGCSSSSSSDLEDGSSDAGLSEAAAAGQQQPELEQRSVAPSRAPTDISFMVGGPIDPLCIAHR